jgi:hypothetical protein
MSKLADGLLPDALGSSTSAPARAGGDEAAAGQVGQRQLQRPAVSSLAPARPAPSWRQCPMPTAPSRRFTP